jgi:hypothetical protein
MAKGKEKNSIKAGRKTSNLERRGARRFAVGWDVTVKGTDGTGLSFNEKGALENLSSTGAFLYLGRRLEVGTKLDVWIKTPFKKNNWMKYSAEIVRVEGSEMKAGVAMKFQTARPLFMES